MGLLLIRLLIVFEFCLKIEYRIFIFGLDVVGMKNLKLIYFFQIYVKVYMFFLEFFFMQFYQFSYFFIFDQNIVKMLCVFNYDCFKGKIIIFYQFKLNEKIEIIFIIGFNVEIVLFMKGVFFIVWEVGGGGLIRYFWKYYYKNMYGQY